MKLHFVLFNSLVKQSDGFLHLFFNIFINFYDRDISNEGYNQGAHDINNNIIVLATYLDDFIYFATLFLVGR